MDSKYTPVSHPTGLGPRILKMACSDCKIDPRGLNYYYFDGVNGRIIEKNGDTIWYNKQAAISQPYLEVWYIYHILCADIMRLPSDSPQAYKETSTRLLSRSDPTPIGAKIIDMIVGRTEPLECISAIVDTLHAHNYIVALHLGLTHISVAIMGKDEDVIDMSRRHGLLEEWEKRSSTFIKMMTQLKDVKWSLEAMEE